ncbi:MAG: hypothetical protein RBR67_07545 [Desulfobacterium sp.]|nr:hypothetical protein [Desulfobacterium sp.]
MGEPDSKGGIFLSVEKNLNDVRAFNELYWKPLLPVTQTVRVRHEVALYGDYFIKWDCGADFSADTVEARWENISEKVA